MLRLGYCLPFLSTPPLPLFPSQCLLPAPSPSRGLLWRRSPWASLPWVLWSLLHSLLQPSVHSVEDLVVMASGHRPLPSHSLCGRVSFQMVTIQSVLLAVRQGDWMASIGLMEVYLQVPVPQLLVTFFASCSVSLSVTSKRCALASPQLRRSSPGSWLLFRLYSILWGSI